VVEDSAMKQALLTAHREFGLATPENLGVFRDQTSIPET